MQTIVGTRRKTIQKKQTFSRMQISIDKPNLKIASQKMVQLLLYVFKCLEGVKGDTNQDILHYRLLTSMLVCY
jgi:hypothetical protein